MILDCPARGGIRKTLAVMVFLGLPSPLVAQAELPLEELLVGTTVRTYRASVPSRVADRPGLVIVFHGSSGDAERIRRNTGFRFEDLSETTGDIVVYPNGLGGWNGCRRAAGNPANSNGIDDVAFMRAIVEHFDGTQGIDRDRVFATGFSGGGHMAFRLALEAPDLVTAVAAISASLPTEENIDCRPSGRAVSVLLMNGADDPINPYGGGPVGSNVDPASSNRVLSAEESFTYWSDLAGLNGPTSVQNLPDRVPEDGSTLEVRTRASHDVEVTLVTVHGGGHTIPGPVVEWAESAGGINRDASGADLVWAFFQRH